MLCKISLEPILVAALWSLACNSGKGKFGRDRASVVEPSHVSSGGRMGRATPDPIVISVRKPMYECILAIISLPVRSTKQCRQEGVPQVKLKDTPVI